MINRKNIKTGIITLSTLALSTFAFPFVQSNAAPSTASTMRLVNQMYFHIAGKQAPTARFFEEHQSSHHSGNTGSNHTGSNSQHNPGNTGSNDTSSNPGSNGTGSTTTPSTPSDNGTTDQSSALADKIIATGSKFLGTPYQFGAAAGQTRTFDCSSFTQYVFKQNGINLPRSSRQQYTVGVSVPRDQIKKGDLLFFTTSHSGGRIGHVGIYAGNNTILHTWGSKGVQFESLDRAWLKQGYVGAKRVIK